MTWTHDAQHEINLQAHRIRIVLRDVPTVLADIEPAPRPGAGRASSDPKLPISQSVLDAKEILRNTLTTWARVVLEESDAEMDFADTLEQVAQWLAVQATWLAHHPAAEDCEQELRGAVEGVRRLIDRPTIVFHGPCPECGTGIYTSEHARTYTCAECGQQMDPGEVKESNLEFVRDRYFPAADLARILTSQGQPITAALIRQWGHRGKLGGYCKIETHSAFYRAGDVIDEIEDRRIAA